MHKGQLLQIIPLMNTMIINLLPTKCISCDQYFLRAKFTFNEPQLCMSCQHVLFSSSLDCPMYCFVMKNNVENGAS